MSKLRPTLYSFRRCPYAMRARMAIASAGIACDLREVVLRDKPAEMLAVSPKGTVPVIITPNGDVIEESLDIAHWALAQSDPENWLTPPDGDMAGMSNLIQQADGPFKSALDRYKYANRYIGVEVRQQREMGLEFLVQLNTRLADHAYLFGARDCLADIAIFPFVRQFANTDRSWFDGLALPNLQSWLAAHLESPRFNAIMKKYPQWKTGDIEQAFPPLAA